VFLGKNGNYLAKFPVVMLHEQTWTAKQTAEDFTCSVPAKPCSAINTLQHVPANLYMSNTNSNNTTVR